MFQGEGDASPPPPPPSGGPGPPESQPSRGGNTVMSFLFNHNISMDENVYIYTIPGSH